ncbi:MAG: hypothetical protein Q7V63_03595 [Gammaproteobacteria bacterium]|nr:hypothetical protein [Gammaproteobacteria bacterium]
MTGIEFATDARNIIQNVISPMLSITTIISQFLGLFLILYGLMRLYRHNEGSMMHRVSPMGTVMTFVAGVVLISYTPELSVLSNSLLGGGNAYLTNTCPGGGVDQQTGVVFCPILGYLQEIPAGSTDNTQAIKTLAYAVLFLIGTISFIRGFVELIKLGEGQGQGGVAKAITHIFAGVAGVNAESLYNFFENVLTSNLT